MPRKLLIDTDAGTDDAVALSVLLHAMPQEIVGITTVAGNTQVSDVTRNVCYIREQMAMPQLPIYQGSAKAITRSFLSSDFIHGKDGFGDMGLRPDKLTYESLVAPMAIIQAAEEYQGALEILTLGPLTNLAIALILRPDIAGLIKRCYIMGGLYALPGNITPVAEFNFWADPEAAQRCISTAMPKTIIGWDVTLQGGYLTLEDLDRINAEKGEWAQKLVAMQDIKLNWLRSKGHEVHCFLADALAAAIVIEPNCVRAQTTCAGDVLCNDDDTRGMLVVDRDNSWERAPDFDIVTQVDHQLFRKTVLQNLA